MNIMRRLLGFLLGAAIVATASPAMAGGDKLYKLEMSPSTVATGTGVPMTAKFSNVSPSGGANSSFNSVRLNAPAGYTITSVTGVPSGTATIVSNGAAIQVTGMSPVGKNGSFSINFVATVSGSCAAASWNPNVTGDVWSGSQLSGNSFERQGAAPTTTATCQYSVAITPATFYRGTSTNLTARVTNLAPSSGPAITSITLSPPADITATTSYSVNIAGGAYADIPIAATAPCNTADAGDVWTSSASGSTGSFTRNGPEPIQGVTGQCKLAFDTLPPTIPPGVISSPVSVILRDGANQPVAGTGTVTLAAMGGCSIAEGTNPLATTNGGVSFGNLKFAKTSTGATDCTLSAAWNDPDVLPTPPALIPFASVTNAGTLACDDPSTPELEAGAAFNASVGGATVPETTGFFVGFRAPKWKSGPCTQVQWVATNTIGGGGGVYDLNGFLLGTNTASIVYGADATGGVLLAHTITFAIENADANGFPDALRQTKYCVTDLTLNPTKNCTATGVFANAQVCTSPTVAITSIPGWTAAGPGPSAEPGCIRGSTWSIATCPTGLGPKCVQVSVDILEARDPPWAR